MSCFEVAVAPVTHIALALPSNQTAGAHFVQKGTFASEAVLPGPVLQAHRIGILERLNLNFCARPEGQPMAAGQPPLPPPPASTDPPQWTCARQALLPPASAPFRLPPVCSCV